LEHVELPPVVRVQQPYGIVLAAREDVAVICGDRESSKLSTVLHELGRLLARIHPPDPRAGRAVRDEVPPAG
jgi:hypothetical protein